VPSALSDDPERLSDPPDIPALDHATHRATVERVAAMRTILNIIWLVLAGLWLAIAYVLAAILMTITIVGIPFALQALKLAGYALWPFGRTLIPSQSRHRTLSGLGNILWFIFAGWWLALSHLITGCLLCLTVIGIPLGVADFKMAVAALFPFGTEIVHMRDLQRGPPDAITYEAGARKT
jgi:uncharacterized membrane protein YccF (DUF307 family)